MDRTDTLAGESLTFGLLGRLLYRYPDRAWLQFLADEGVFSDVPFASKQPDMAAGLALMQDWASDSAGGMAEEAFERLRADYTRLFIGPDRVLAPPWESVHLSVDRLLFQEQTLEVRAWYQRYGLAAARLHSEPDDHIGLELAFLSHLAMLGTDAIERQKHTELAELLDAQQSFLSDHPLKWAPAWCDAVATHAQTTFYRGIALMVRGALLELAANAIPADSPSSSPCWSRHRT